MYFQGLVLVGILGLSSGQYLKDLYPPLLVENNWVNFLLEVERGSFKCNPQVGLAIDISSSIGNIAFFGQVYPLIMKLNEFLTNLPMSGNNNNTGSDVILIPFHRHAVVQDLKTVGQKLSTSSKLLDKAMSRFKVSGGSCIACAWHEGGKAVYAKANKRAAPGFLILISDGRDNDNAKMAEKSIEEAHALNLNWNIETMVIGVQGWREMAADLLESMAGKGHFWELPSENAHDVPNPMILRALAWSIVNRIAGYSCQVD